MGRRKIEIKAIKDDRNRSVTFLKRKGGLFKKAHELSVLCSVEVAVIIFGTNKKLYEYSSHDIHETINRYSYYGQPHEHKGPQDYANKQGGDDDDDEDGDEGNGEEQGQPQQQQQQHPHPPHQQGPSQMSNQPVYAPLMRPGPSASPPVGNGNMQFRRTTPQPPPMGIGSRPASRNDIIRRSTPHMPQHHTPPMHTPPMQTPGQPPNGFPHPQMPSQVYGMPGQQPMFQQPQPPQHPHTAGFAPPGFTQFQQPHPQIQQMYQQGQGHPQGHPPGHPQGAQPGPPQQQQQGPQPPHQPQPPPEQRRSMPPNFQEPPRPQSHPQVQIQAPPPPPSAPPPPQQQQQQEQQQQEVQVKFEGLQPHHPKPVKSHSIFTPIDNSRSMLAQSWGLGASPIDKLDTPVKSEPEDRAKSADPSSLSKSSLPSGPPPPPKPEPPFQSSQRTQSTTSLGGAASSRPRLKVHIPSEPSEDGISAGSGPGSTMKAQDASSQSTPSKNKDRPAGSGVVLPPPSPSASAILSAGATGPSNPFARPLPPTSAGGPSQSNTAAFSGNQGAFGDQTPISALPSRFAGQLLPSPNQFFSDWSFNRNGDESAILPSPLNFQTPVNLHGPGLGTSTSNNESEDAKKRKLDEEARDQGGEKKVKT